MGQTGKLAFLYAGQGSQQVGMGSDLLQSRPDLFERYFGMAEAISGLPIIRYCLEGPLEMLTRTEVAQPAILAHALALNERAAECGLQPDLVAGHSLGEYAAAIMAGAIAPEDAMRLVCLRGCLMNEAQAERPGAMAALGGLSENEVSSLCADAADAGTVVVSNQNGPTHIVVSGDLAAVEKVMALAAEAGAVMSVRLRVGAGFHSPLMKHAQSEMRQATAAVTFWDAVRPMATYVSGVLIQKADEFRQELVDQVVQPVNWIHCVENLRTAGCEAFLLIGPNRALEGLTRPLYPKALIVTVDSLTAMSAVADTRLVRGQGADLR